MKILLTGGGSGGHFYPLIAVAQSINDITEREKILDAKLYFASENPYDKKALFDNHIEFVKVPAGKLRRYFSFRAFIDFFKTAWGILRGIFTVYAIYPDVVFGKGGYASFPTLISAKILGIPVFIHESDSVPGRTNLWASKFASRIAISFEEAGTFFPKEKTAYTGHPVRKDIIPPLKEGAYEYLKLSTSIPTILVLGGSQGAEIINETILSALPDLLTRYQIIHQTGEKNLDEVVRRGDVILGARPEKERYKPFGYLNDLSLRMSAGAGTLIISRAGSAIFEIAEWGLPSIVIPITDSHGDHQRKNAFSYARSGAAAVIEENNLSPHLLVSEIDKLMKDAPLREKMSKAAKSFNPKNASETIARELIQIAVSHETK